MHHLACLHWSNKTDTFWGVLAKNTTQKQLKIIDSAGRKAFEILKLENYIPDSNKTCQICIPP